VAYLDQRIDLRRFLMANPTPVARAGRVLRQISRHFAPFVQDQSGAIAIYFALSAIVLIGVAGLAVDAARG
jgi:Flp pilus assembly protein TadG